MHCKDALSHSTKYTNSWDYTLNLQENKQNNAMVFTTPVLISYQHKHNKVPTAIKDGGGRSVVRVSTNGQNIVR